MTFGRLVDDFCTTVGMLEDMFRINFKSLINNTRTTFEGLLDNLWMTFGRLDDDWCTTVGILEDMFQINFKSLINDTRTTMATPTRTILDQW